MDTLPVQSTKASEANASGACGSPLEDQEHELVRGHGATENTEFNFSNPLYAEPEGVIASVIYESVSLFSASRHVVAYCKTFLVKCMVTAVSGSIQQVV